jgi:hypothetical protein
MTKQSRSSRAPVPTAADINVRAIAEHLWGNALSEIGPIEIHDDCRTRLRDMIAHGTTRMALEHRTAPDDLGTAQRNLARVVGLMKYNAGLLGHPQWVGEDTLMAADQTLVVLGFRPWPFRIGKAYEQRG